MSNELGSRLRRVTRPSRRGKAKGRRAKRVRGPARIK